MVPLPHQNIDRLLRMRAVLELTSLCRAAIYDLIARKAFPRPVKIGRVAAWSEREVADWIEAHKAARPAPSDPIPGN